MASLRFVLPRRHRRACPTPASSKCPSFGKSGSPGYIQLCRKRARLFQAGNDLAASFQLDRHKIRYFSHKSLAPSHRPRAVSRNKTPAVLRSVCKIADKAGTQHARPATSSTSDRDNGIAQAKVSSVPASFFKKNTGFRRHLVVLLLYSPPLH